MRFIAVHDRLHHAGDRVAPRGKLGAIGFHVDDGLARDARIHRRLRDRRGNDGDQARIEGRRDQIFAAEARPRALIGARHIVRHVLARKLGQRVHGGDLHFHIDGFRSHIERAAKNIGKTKHIIDLVRIIRPAGRDDGVRAHGMGVFRRDFRIGIGHGEDDGVRGHGLDHVGSQRALGGKAEKDVGSDHRLFERALVRRDGVGRFPLVHARRPAPVNDALGVAQGDVFRREADGLDQVQAGDAGRAGAVADQLGFLDVAAGQVDGVDHAGGGDDRGAMLVIVKNGNVHQFAQALFDDETFRRLDVFKIDAAEGRPEVANGGDEFVRIFRRDFEIDRIDVGEALEQDGFALHDRLGGQGAEIAEAENRGSVGDDRDEIALDRVIIGFRRIFRDRMHRYGDAGGIGERKVALRRHGLGRRDLELSGPAAGMKQERFLLGESRPLAAARLGIGHF